MIIYVTVSKAKILGNSELYIKSGSDINLTCIVLQTPEPPSFIYWYRGGNVINYSQRGGISVVTEKQTRTSRLLISRALASDSGNYTCSPSSSDAASVFVHVLNGEQPAAMQHGTNTNKAILWTMDLSMLLVLQCFLLERWIVWMLTENSSFTSYLCTKVISVTFPQYKKYLIVFKLRFKQISHLTFSL